MKYGIYIAAVAAFVIAGFFIITYAAGYKVDITNRSLNQTGLISVSSDNADIYIDDILIGNGKITKRNLEPKGYRISVKKEGYFDWSKQVELESGEAEIINYAVLFKQSPVVSEYSVNQSDFLNKFADSDGLQIINNEIYQNDNFVTRYSKDVFGLSWYTDQRYLAFSNDSKLKIIEIDGTNEISLLDKASQTPVVFVNSGRVVIFENDGKLYQAQIR